MDSEADSTMALLGSHRVVPYRTHHVVSRLEGDGLLHCRVLAFSVGGRRGRGHVISGHRGCGQSAHFAPTRWSIRLAQVLWRLRCLGVFAAALIARLFSLATLAHRSQ